MEMVLRLKVVLVDKYVMGGGSGIDYSYGGYLLFFVLWLKVVIGGFW